LKVKADSLPDAHAHAVYTELTARGISDPALEVAHMGKETVFHVPCMTSRVANQLYSAGFHEIDIYIHGKGTPLMNIGISNRIR
jgi:hypothetical protein